MHDLAAGLAVNIRECRRGLYVSHAAQRLNGLSAEPSTPAATYCGIKGKFWAKPLNTLKALSYLLTVFKLPNLLPFYTASFRSNYI